MDGRSEGEWLPRKKDADYADDAEDAEDADEI